MPSLIPGYEYDIFISYRHNDNRANWVTQFVKNLKDGLAASIKGKVSVYFDSSGADALRVTDDVDESLKSKLRCVVFIPIISQTYCDENSFAWKHEFTAFVNMASAQTPGLKIKLNNGNVASRVLPVRIHELDKSDTEQIEALLGGVMRPVDFIFRSDGVARPLLEEEVDPKSNLDHTYYRDQLNKVVRGVKELMSAVQNPEMISSQAATVIPPKKKKKIALIAFIFLLLVFAGYGASFLLDFPGSSPEVDRSIAVLPFENMNKDSTQDYFSNGMTEDILNHLVKISDLKVKSRTSTLAYKGTTKLMTEIGRELNVANILEGSVRRVGDKVRIVVQLIDARNDVHVWSETYDRDFSDVLTVQSEIAIEIAKALQLKLTPQEKETVERQASGNVTAYDYFMRARNILNSFGQTTSTYGYNKSDLLQSMALINEAIALDPTFSKSYSLKGLIWFGYAYFGAPERVWVDSALTNASRALVLDPTDSYGQIVRVFVHGFLGNVAERDEAIEEMYRSDPNNADSKIFMGWKLLREQNEKGAELIIDAIENQYSSHDVQFYLELGTAFYGSGDLPGYIRVMKKALSLNPSSNGIRCELAEALKENSEYEDAIGVLKAGDQEDANIIDCTAHIKYHTKDYQGAADLFAQYKVIESKYEDSTHTVPFRHRLAMTYVKLGRKNEADALIEEHRKILAEMIDGRRSKGAWTNLGGIYYDHALCLAYQNKSSEAMQALDSAYEFGWRSNWYYHNDPLLDPLRKDPPFIKLLLKIDAERQFRAAAFARAFARVDDSSDIKNLD